MNEVKMLIPVEKPITAISYKNYDGDASKKITVSALAVMTGGELAAVGIDHNYEIVFIGTSFPPIAEAWREHLNGLVMDKKVKTENEVLAKFMTESFPDGYIDDEAFH